MRSAAARLLLAFVLVSAVPAASAAQRQLAAPPDGVREDAAPDDARAEALLAGADAALWLPKLQLVRWVPVGAARERTLGRAATLEAFTAQLERELPLLFSGAFGPFLVKRPASGPVLPARGAAAAAPVPAAQVFADSFESLASWDLGDNTSGAWDFGAAACSPHSGARAADAIRGGRTGSTLACNTFYSGQIVTQITHKTCEGIAGAAQAWADFYLSCALSSNADYIGVGYVPPNSQSWYGYSFTGTTNGWVRLVVNLKQWPALGDVTALACPKILFQFGSSAAGAGFGARIDDLTIGTDTPSFLRVGVAANPPSGPAPLAVAFTANVGGASGGETYRWSFGDQAGSTSTQQNPTFTYTTPGDYAPEVFVYGSGVTATAATLVHVDTPCTPACTATVPGTGTAGSPVSFASSVSGCSGTPTYAWTFGDGQSAAVQSPTHAYAVAGTYPWTFTGGYGSSPCTKSGSITISGGAPALPGDCNGDGRVDVGEVQKVINMLLGVQAVGCGADANADGRIDVAEVQRVINAFLGGGSSGITVTVNPPTATLAAGGTQAFTATVTGTANTAVTWSVQEGSAGGAVTAAGLYTAPQASGVYHVVATSQADATKSGSAAVTVGATQSQKGIVYGTVKDTSGGAIGGAAVTAGALHATTNGQGYFTLSDVPVGDATLVSFSANGYVPSAKVIRVVAGQGSYIDMNLMTAKPTQTIDGGAGGTVGTGGATATFPPGAFVTSAGTPYTGTTKVSVTPFDPTDPAQLNAFPGKFEGITTGGQTVFFVSYGWMDVTATTSDGAALQLAPGKTATIGVPVPAAIQAGAPATLPEWWFDAAAGVWREEGTFTYSGGVYTGTIPHLSIWNCDVGSARCTITGRVVDPTGAPVQCAQVSMLNLGPRGRFTSGETCTGADGRFAVPVDANSSVTITASKGGVKSSPLTTDTCPDGGTRDVGDILLGTLPVKVTLTWGANPSDLDSHLAVPNASGSGWTHVYWVVKSAEDATLDTDDTSGYGPEIVSIKKLHPGTYRYSIHHFSGSGTIASSPAAVNLLIEGKGIYTFAPPAGASGAGDVWHVFDLVVSGSGSVTLQPLNDYLHGKSSDDTTAFFPPH